MLKVQTEKILLEDTTFIVCDVETTGMSAVHSRITEIALIKIRNEEIIDSFTTLLNPLQHIPYMITRLTGISNETVMGKPVFDEVSQKIINFFTPEENECMVFVGHNVSFDYSFVSESLRRLPVPYFLNMKTLCTCKLARRLYPQLKSKSLSSVCTYLNVKQKKKHRAYDDTLATSKIMLSMVNLLQDDYDFETLDELIKFQNSKIFTGENKSPALKRINIDLKSLPKDPGVYLMRSASGEIIYIGKAKCLRDRVSTYFRHNDNLTYKIKKLLTRVKNLEYIITDSELSALILESKLIKKHKPRFNTAIKRFRYHPFLKLDVQNEFPKLTTVYEIENDGAYYYGPFMSRGTVRQLFKIIYDDFKLRKCEEKILKASKKHSNCMYYDIHKCEAPCNLTISKDRYKNTVNEVHNFIIDENPNSALNTIKTQMFSAAENENYEFAAILRNRMQDIQKVMSYQKVITSAINDKKLIIKCDTELKREIFFIHNGKLMKTLTLYRNNEYNQEDFITDLSETIDYLYFSLNKFIKHKYSQEELDEIKVISNWLALNRDRNSFLELSDTDSVKSILEFVLK